MKAEIEGQIHDEGAACKNEKIGILGEKQRCSSKIGFHQGTPDVDPLANFAFHLTDLLETSKAATFLSALEPGGTAG